MQPTGPPGQPPEGCPNLPGIGETPGFSGHAEASKPANEVTPMTAAAIVNAKVLLEKIDMAVFLDLADTVCG